jgi:hypothetical protein
MRLRGASLNPTLTRARWGFVSRPHSCSWNPLRLRGCTHTRATMPSDEPPLGIDQQHGVVTDRAVIIIGALDHPDRQVDPRAAQLRTAGRLYHWGHAPYSPAPRRAVRPAASYRRDVAPRPMQDSRECIPRERWPNTTYAVALYNLLFACGSKALLVFLFFAFCALRAQKAKTIR